MMSSGGCQHPCQWQHHATMSIHQQLLQMPHYHLVAHKHCSTCLPPTSGAKGCPARLGIICWRIKAFYCTPRWILVHTGQGQHTSRQNTSEVHRHQCDSIRLEVITFPLYFYTYSNDIYLNYHWRQKAVAMLKGVISVNIWRTINTEAILIIWILDYVFCCHEN